jgi:DNA (cytosine-5)-methyltransferase 1
MKKSHYLPTYSVGDMFCGCGGLSYGFALTGRFGIRIGCDIKSEALDTFEKNHDSEAGRPKALNEDIRKLTPAAVAREVGRSPSKLARNIDCLIGGPPCEGFSQNRSLGAGGKPSPGSSSRVGKFIDDPRNHLFRWYVDLAASLQPAVVLIENVPDLIRHRDGETRNEVFEALEKAGYRAVARVLHAADYGVPQMRRRAFFLAQRKTDFLETGLSLEFPHPTHVPYPLQHPSFENNANWLPGDAGYWTSVREALGDLPPAFESDDFDHSATAYPSAHITRLRQFLRGDAKAVPYNHIGRKLGRNGLAKVLAMLHGKRATELPEEIRPRSAFHYSYARLRWSEPARTITKFAYHVGSGMFTHPVENRAITMREAARLQTFPDAFRFHASTIRDTSALIGSAVPPLLAYRIAQSVLRYLDNLALVRLPSIQRAGLKRQATDAVMKRLEGKSWKSGTESNGPDQLPLGMGF